MLQLCRNMDKTELLCFFIRTLNKIGLKIIILPCCGVKNGRLRTPCMAPI